MTASDKTIDKIKKSILIHAIESWKGNYKTANRHFKDYTNQICALFQDGYGLDTMHMFLNDDEAAAKFVGAYFLLPYDTKKCQKTLKSICSVQTYGIGPNAKTLLEEWKNGRLKFPVLEHGKVVYKERNQLMPDK